MGVAKNTTKTYRAAQKRYLEFCERFSLQPLPATEQVLILFVAELAQSVSHATIRTYLSGVRNLHLTRGWSDPPMRTLRLDLVLNGIRRAKARPPKVKLPVTPLILKLIHGVLVQQETERDNLAVWAACCLGFFGFLRTAEFTVPQRSAVDPMTHLMVDDIAVDSHTMPSLLQVRIKASKTDQFRQGTSLFLAATGNELCPVAAMLNYLAKRPTHKGPLFVLQSGEPLTRQKFVERFRTALRQAGVRPEMYTGHSFRIGAATTAAAKGVPDNIIKALGRWNSEAYQVYIRIPRERLATITNSLSS